MAEAVLEEAGKFAGGVLSPMNASGDLKARDGTKARSSRPPAGSEAYRQFVDGGWNALSVRPAHGGQGLPRLVSALVEEMWNAANIVVRLVSDADARRDRGDGTARLGRPEAAPTCRRWSAASGPAR